MLPPGAQALMGGNCPRVPLLVTSVLSRVTCLLEIAPDGRYHHISSLLTQDGVADHQILARNRVPSYFTAVRRDIINAPGVGDR